MGLSASVGKNGVNRAADVKVVQELLNSARKRFPKFARIQPLLTVDKACGPITITAIERFQSKVMGTSNPDGLINVGKSTWKKLNGNSSKDFLKTSSMVWSNNLIETVQVKRDALYVKPHDYKKMLSTLPTIKDPLSAIPVYSQGNRTWSSKNLGKSSSKSIGVYGCTLTCLTMAAHYLGCRTPLFPTNIYPSDLNPNIANEIMKKSKGVFGPGQHSMTIVSGAEALGMDAKDTGFEVLLPTLKSKSQHLLTINQTLQSGGLVAAHVDYKANKYGDHWVLIISQFGNTYKAIDPNRGLIITLYTTPDSGAPLNANAILYGRTRPTDSCYRQHIALYEVVRYISLKEKIFNW